MQMRWALLLAVSACTGLNSNPDGSETIATSRRPTNLALSRQSIYFVLSPTSEYELYEVSASGGEPNEVAQGGVIFTTVGDDSGVYWVGSNGFDGFVRALPTGATAAIDLITTPPVSGFVSTTYRNVVLDADSVYFADTQGNAWKIPKSGGQPALLGKTDTTAGSVALSPDGLWVSTMHGAKLLPSGPDISFGDAPPDGLAWAEGALFAVFGGSGFADGSLVKVTLDGGPEQLASRLILPGELTVHDEYLYFATGNEDSAIRRVPFSGGGSEALAQGAWPSGIAFDDAYIYFCDEYNDRIRRVLY